jgi:hypothetical protein
VAVPRWLDPEPPVYEAALSGLYSYEIAVASLPSTCGVPERSIEGISSGLISAFRSANAPGVSLGNISSLSRHFAVANSVQLAALDSQGLTFSSAGSAHLKVVRISRVGFDAQKTEALLCLQTGGIFSLVQLHKFNGIWQVVRFEPLQVASWLPHNYSFKRTAATGYGTIMPRPEAAA